jgi:hypothetical protein
MLAFSGTSRNLTQRHPSHTIHNWTNEKQQPSNRTDQKRFLLQTDARRRRKVAAPGSARRGRTWRSPLARETRWSRPQRAAARSQMNTPAGSWPTLEILPSPVNRRARWSAHPGAPDPAVPAAERAGFPRPADRLPPVPAGRPGRPMHLEPEIHKPAGNASPRQCAADRRAGSPGINAHPPGRRPGLRILRCQRFPPSGSRPLTLGNGAVTCRTGVADGMSVTSLQ